MRIKRFVAADMRGALRRIREELGPEAVILSNRKVEEGVEVTAAMDYEAVAAPEPAAGAARAGRALPGLEAYAEHAPGATRVPGPAYPPDSAGGVPGPRRAESRPARGGFDETEPVLKTMHEEMRSLRGLLEHQLARLAQTELERRQPSRAEVMRQFEALGIDPAIARAIAAQTDERAQPGAAWRQALEILTRGLQCCDESETSSGVLALVGPTGVGKTTTIAKLAARHVLRRGPGQVGLITTDSFRVGAHEQLRTFGRILDVPVRVANDTEELRQALDQFGDRELVLVDTAGSSQANGRFAAQVRLVRASSPLARLYLVVSATSQPLALEESMRAFDEPPRACVVTKLDESTGLGGVLSLLLRHGLSAAFVSDGQRVPEDLSPARAHALVARALSIMHALEERLRGTRSDSGPEELLAHGYL